VFLGKICQLDLQLLNGFYGGLERYRFDFFCLFGESKQGQAMDELDE
jgi:hypothetical protein